MELRDSIEKISKNLCRRTLQSFRSFCLKRYLKLPNQFFCRRTQKYHEFDPILFSKAHMEDQESCSGAGCTEKQSPVAKLTENEREGKKSKESKKQGTDLGKKIKELEMIDVGDMEHVLDVEEALHYYSKLKSPVYIDIIDGFFMDMYKDFSKPVASRKIKKSSTRRFIRL